MTNIDDEIRVVELEERARKIDKSFDIFGKIIGGVGLYFLGKWIDGNAGAIIGMIVASQINYFPYWKPNSHLDSFTLTWGKRYRDNFSERYPRLFTEDLGKQ